MLVIACVLLYLAIVKKFEPLLLLPIAFGMLLTNLLGSDIGVSITGNAGPGASEGKPVGLVYIAVAMNDVVYCQEHHFMSTRTENKLRIAQTAISMAIDKLLEAKNTEDNN